MEYADYRHIQFERREPNILWMTLNRPEVLNAADARLHTELVKVWDTIDKDPSVHVVVVTGAGRAFSAGGALQLVEDAHRDFEEIARILDEARDLVYNILRCSKPIISAINGPAVGAGLVVALLAAISAFTTLSTLPRRKVLSDGSHSWYSLYHVSSAPAAPSLRSLIIARKYLCRRGSLPCGSARRSR